MNRIGIIEAISH
ncbi:Protein of unknown function [Bacillus mycoides]|uniref:Uncharacterized protein n=1 Tax=Bacillus mycoides TaxID=1405 RepID=A0A1G4EHA0_BACMY|nr:Protein of unknown function [Bacillus mycoides]